MNKYILMMILLLSTGCDGDLPPCHKATKGKGHTWGKWNHVGRHEGLGGQIYETFCSSCNIARRKRIAGEW
jgi:hypothetical protein